MSRKSWSNVFLLLAGVNLAFAIAPGSPLRLPACAGFAVCLLVGTYLRRRMIKMRSGEVKHFR